MAASWRVIIPGAVVRKSGEIAVDTGIVVLSQAACVAVLAGHDTHLMCAAIQCVPSCLSGSGNLEN